MKTTKTKSEEVKTPKTPKAKKSKVISMQPDVEEPELTKDEAYKEIYLQIRKEVEDIKNEQDPEKEMKWISKAKKILMIPYLDEKGFDTLDKISLEAELMSKKESKLPAADREVILRLCQTIAYRYRYLLVLKDQKSKTE